MLRPGHLVALCVLALLTLGVIMVNSADMSVASKERAVTFESIVFSRSSAYMVAALGAMAACALLPIRRLTPRALRVGPGGMGGAGGMGGSAAGEADSAGAGVADAGGPRSFSAWARGLGGHWLRLAPMWACVAAMLVILTLVYVPGLGRTVNGSSRWISLPVPVLESLQPSEIAKWGLLVVLAWYATVHAARLREFFGGLLPALAAAGVLAALIVVEDLGTGVLIGGVAAIVLLAAGARWWQMAMLAPVPLLGIVAAIATSDYRRARLLAFLDPYEHPQTIGYHMIQSMVAVANGNVAGRGLGHGLQKFGYLPEDRTDFLFAIICEEMGVMGCVLVVGLYVALLWTALGIIRSERWAFYKLLGLGIIATVGFQAVINLFVVVGLGPTKGIALPLLSSGGTGWILTAASLGLLIAMDRTQGMPTEEAELARHRETGPTGVMSEEAFEQGQEVARGGGSDDVPSARGNAWEAERVISEAEVQTAEAPAASRAVDDARDEAVDQHASDRRAHETNDVESWPGVGVNDVQKREPLPAQAVRGFPSSKITILTSPGQQGWLFSGPAPEAPRLGTAAARAVEPLAPVERSESVATDRMNEPAMPPAAGAIPRELKPRIRLQLKPAEPTETEDRIEGVAEDVPGTAVVVNADAARAWLDGREPEQAAGERRESADDRS